MVDGYAGDKFFFSVARDAEQRALLGEQTKKQIIFEAETFAGVLAYLLWNELILRRNCFLFVDNEGTKFSMIKGASENLVVDTLCAIFAELEMHIETTCWLARVPSHSNIADKPSRADVTELLQQGYKDHSEMAASITKDLFASMKRKAGEKGWMRREVPMQKECQMHAA